MSVDYRFDRGSLDLADAQRIALELWADLGLNAGAKAMLKRDGVRLDGLRLTGPSPFLIEAVPDPDADCNTKVTVVPSFAEQTDALLELWQIYMMRSFREASARTG